MGHPKGCSLTAELIACFLRPGNDQALAAVIDPLIELVDTSSKLFQKMFDDIIRFCIMSLKIQTFLLRHFCFRIDTGSFSERAPKMCS